MKKIALLTAVLTALSAHAAPLKILTYDSMLGKGSYGAFLTAEFAKVCADCKVEFAAADDFSGLLGKLRQAGAGKIKASFDAVLGLDQRLYDIALAEALVSDGFAFDQSPFAIVVDTEKLKPADWPTSWAEVPTKLRGALIVQDPRLSSPGVGWLRAIYEFSLLSKAQAKQTVGRVFPSWSDAYSAFLKGEGKAVWTYQSSEAYHLCNDGAGKNKRYRVLPLKEGYPQQVEFYARRKGAIADLARFETFLKSKAAQTELAKTQWMLPISEGVTLPDCYREMTAVKALAPRQPLDAKRFQSWLDQWAL